MASKNQLKRAKRLGLEGFDSKTPSTEIKATIAEAEAAIEETPDAPIVKGGTVTIKIKRPKGSERKEINDLIVNGEKHVVPFNEQVQVSRAVAAALNDSYELVTYVDERDDGTKKSRTVQEPLYNMVSV